MNIHSLPLEGIRVIEIAHALAGPLAGNIMADLGADVIKVEKPDGGDDARHWGPPFGPDGETSLYFHSQNRNKRGVTLDLKSPEGVEKLHFLCADADILIQTLRPGLVEKYGVDGKTMLARHPRLIYCNVSAYGSEGPLAKQPGFDPLLQAYSGMMSITGEPGSRPTFNGASINDKATGMFCAIGALAALHQRERTGHGTIIDASLFDAAVHWVEGPLNACLATGKVPQKHGTGSLYIVPYQVFEARDGALVIAAGNDRLFTLCANILGRPEWAEDERFSTAPQRVVHKATLIPLIEEAVRPWERSALLDALEKVGVPSAPVNDIGELARSEQLQAVDLLQSPPGSGLTVVGLPFKINGVRPKSALRAPGLGEHNGEIFEEALSM